MQKITKLYRVYSVDETQDGDKICIEYFYADKNWDDVNYNQIVKNYSDMDSTNKKNAVEIVNEMFTDEEVELLQFYFEEEGVMEFFTHEYLLPISKDHLYSDNFGIERIIPFKKMEEEGNLDIVYINNNGLPFKVAAFRHYG